MVVARFSSDGNGLSEKYFQNSEWSYGVLAMDSRDLLPCDLDVTSLLSRLCIYFSVASPHSLQTIIAMNETQVTKTSMIEQLIAVSLIDEDCRLR